MPNGAHLNHGRDWLMADRAGAATVASRRFHGRLSRGNVRATGVL